MTTSRQTMTAQLVGKLTLALFLGAMWCASAFGQVTSASIVGQVTDESGGILPGVTVSASSPALQVPAVSAVTDTTGQYCLSEIVSRRVRLSPTRCRVFRRSSAMEFAWSPDSSPKSTYRSKSARSPKQLR